MMRVLVTGGAGFVGHHICAELAHAGLDVLAIDSLEAGVNLTPIGVELLKMNIANITHHDFDQCDAIVHAAARADISNNWVAHWERTRLWQSNIHATLQLLESIAVHPKPIVFLSTCAVYGDTNPAEPATEKQPCIATSPYAASKLAGEALVQAYATAKETPWHVLRLACVAGAGLHHGHAADFVKMMREHGAIHARNNGGRKSYVHARDVAGAVLASLLGQVPSGVYNLAGGDNHGRGWSWRDTIEVMGEMAKKTIPVTFEDRVHGWIGDPMAVVSGAKIERWYAYRYNVRNGMIDALASLGWP